MQYETAKNRSDEAQISKHFAHHMGCEYVKLGPPKSFARIDGALIKIVLPGQDLRYIHGVFEVKKRKTSFGYYPTIYVALDKMQALESAADVLGVDSYIVHEYLDGIYYARVGCMRSYDELYPPCAYQVIETRKREDRGGGWQYVVEIPAAEWQKVEIRADRHGAKQMQSGARGNSHGAVNAV